MSTTIDQRVVEMRFDNKQFERNVSSTMSTLDKLKEKLNFSKSSRGLDDLNRAAKNVDMRGLGAGVEAVHAKFSALEVMGVTALANITNSAVNAGKRIVSALTIDPIKTGFQEYETQINSVQTILANTESKGSTIDDVNRALEELNKYADQTIYNFTEMTRNIGTFTAAGVDLDTSTNAIKGIANLAAVSGSTSQQASTAMYQLSQALASGTVKLMDWNSVVNAGMGGEVFQNALKETARVHGVAIDEMIEEQGSFRETLKDGWLTSEILTDTLQKFTLTTEGLTKEQIEANREMLRAQGYTEDQIDGIFKLGKTATDAATKVKTFTQLWDVLKESAQSGWAQTWKLIVGDFEQAKALFTPLSEFLTGIINGMSEARNAVLESALGRGFTKTLDSVNKILGATKETIDGVVKPIENVTSALGDLDTIVEDTILGKFGNGKERFDTLAEAGVNFYRVQNKVNETLGDSHRYTEEQIAEQDKLLGKQGDVTEATEKQEKATVKLGEEEKNRLKLLAQMDEAQLKSKGYTDEQIQALKDLGVQADKLGMDLGDFIDNLDQINGRWLMINSFKNIGKGLIDVFKAIGEAWKEVFPPKSVEERATSLFNLIAAFHKLTSSLVGVIYDGDKLTETGDKLVRTLKGVFAIIDIIATVTGGVLKTAFKVVVEILKRFDLNILDVTAAVGDAIVGFSKWIDKLINVSGIVDFLVPIIKKAARFISEFVGAVKNSKWLSAFADYLHRVRVGLGEMFGNLDDLDQFKHLMQVFDDAKNKIKNWIDTLKGSKNLPADIISGLANGIRNGAPEVIAAVFDLGWAIITGICNVLKINSPSKEMENVGGYAVDGLVVGIQNGASKIKDTIVEIGRKIVEWFKNIDFGAIFAVGVGVSMITLTSKIGQALTVLAGPLSGLGDMFEEIGDGAKSFLKGLGSYFRANAWEARAKAMISFAAAIAIMAGAVYLLSTIDTGTLWSCVGAIAALATVIGVFATVMSKSKSITGGGIGGFFSSLKESINFAGIGAALMGLSILLLALTLVVKQLGKLDPEEAKQGFLGLAGLVGAIALVFAAYGTLVKGKSANNINKLGGMLIKMSVALLMLVYVTKLVGRLSEDDMLKGAVAMGAFVVFVGLMAAASRISGKGVNKLGGMLLKMSVAMLLMVSVAKLAGQLDENDMIKGAVAMGAFIVFVGLLTAITRLVGGNKLDKVGTTLLAMAGSILILTIVGKLIAGMTWGDMGKAAVGIAGLVAVIAVLVGAMSKFGKGNELKRLGTTLVMASVAIGILAGVAALLGLLDLGHLAKGITAVGLLGLVMSGMIVATRGASACTGNLVAMTVAIGLMAAAVAALSLIDTFDLVMATAALSALMGMFTLMIKAAGQAQLAIGGLIVMTGAITILGGLLYLLAGLPIEGTIAAALSLSTLMLAMSAALVIISNIQTVSPMALGALAAMTVIVGLLGGILWLLQDLPVDATLAVAVSLSALLLAMSAALSICVGIGASAGLAVTGAGILVAFIAVIAGMATYIDDVLALATEKLPEVGENLSNFISKLEPFLTAISGFDASFVDNISALVEGIAVLAATDLLTKITSWLPGDDDSLVNFGTNLATFGEKLGEFADHTSGITAESIGPVVEAATKLAGIEPPGDGLFGTDGIDDFGRNLVTFGNKLVAFVDITKNVDPVALEGIVAAMTDLTSVKVPDDGFFGTDGIDDYGRNLVTFGEGMAAFLTSIQGLSTDNVSQVVAAARSVAGVQIPEDGFFGFDGIDNFGSDIGKFGQGMASFLLAIQGLSTDNVSQVVAAARSVAGVQIPEDGFFGFDGIDNFGNDLRKFGTGMAGFLTAIQGLSTENVSQVVAAARSVAGVEIPDDGLFGGDGIDNFGKDIQTFGTGMAGFLSAIQDLSTSNVSQVVAAARSLAGITVPEDGTFGGDGIDNFGKDIAKFGESFAEYSVSVSEVNTSAVNNSVIGIRNILGAVNELAGVDASGVETFKNAIDTLGTISIDGIVTAFENATVRFVALGASVMNSIIQGITNRQPLLTTTMTTVAQALVTAISNKNMTFNTAGSGIITQIINGINTQKSNLSTNFNGTIQSLLDAINNKKTSFNTAGSGLITQFVNGINSKKTSLSSAVTGSIQDLLNAINNKKTSFNTAGSGLITNLINGINSKKTTLSSTVTNSVQDLLNAINSKKTTFNAAGSGLITQFINGINSKKVSLSDAVTSCVKNMTQTLNGKKEELRSIGAALIDRLINGISSKTSSLSTALTTAVNTAKDNARAYYDSYYSAGVYLVDGFAAGITARTWYAAAQSAAMANAAEAAAKNALDINSPSKVFRALGYSVPEGFAMGIDKLSGMAEASATSMSDTAIGGVKSSISRIADAMNADMDVAPTIRPLLDLTDVKSGASTIGSLLNAGSSVGVLTNVNSINTMMNRRSQNGSNDDVVSAIDKLRKDVSNLDRNSYSIGNITYDESSAISDTIKTLTRAVVREGRV